MLCEHDISRLAAGGPLAPVFTVVFTVVVVHLQTLDGQFEDVGCEFRGLFEGEVAPVDDKDEAVDLELWVLNQNLQREQDGPQDVCERVPDGGGGNNQCVCVNS